MFHIFIFKLYCRAKIPLLVQEITAVFPLAMTIKKVQV